MKQKIKDFNISYFSAILFILICFCNLSAIAQEDNWTHFRGSNINGISNETASPTVWNDSINIIWKTKISYKGLSSPVIYGDQVWLTTATEDGKQMFGICISFKTGKELLNIKVFEPETIYSKHNVNSYASPTPCIEQGFVYLHFGSYGTACLRTNDGFIVWKRTDIKCKDVRGPGSSPILYKNLLILHFEGIDKQYLVALNKKTGQTVWMKDRPKECYDKLEVLGKKAFITPIIINVTGKDMLISNGSAVCCAYNPETGEEIWRVVQGTNTTVSMPIFENGTLFFYTGDVTPAEGDNYSELLAVDPKGSGDITGSHVLWRFKSLIEQTVTPLVKNGLLYALDYKSNLFCLDAKTGKTIYTKKLPGNFISSPLYSGGNLYFTSTNGETTIIKEGKTPQVIRKNKLREGGVFATPAILRKSIIIRAGSFVYRIGS
jgi:outer membrane protein assembly factor BamB